MAPKSKGPAMPTDVSIDYSDGGEEVSLSAVYSTPDGMEPEAWKGQLHQILKRIADGYAEDVPFDSLFKMEVTEDGDVEVFASGDDGGDRRETAMATATGMVIDLLLTMNEEYALAFGQYLQMRASGLNEQPPSRRPQQAPQRAPGGDGDPGRE